MLGIITATMMVVGPAVNWLLDENEKMDAEDEAQGKLAVRTLAGQLAASSGEEKFIPYVEWIEVPPGDPAWGGKPVRLTPQEASWWMGACHDPQDHIPEIRRITRLQPSRWAQ